MKIVFFGTPEYALPIPNSIYKRFKNKSGKSPVIAVVTQKPSPEGRRQLLKYSEVDNWAHKRNIPVFHNPEDLVTKNIQADLGILAAYGEIISPNVINHFPHGILNVHPSLLPKWRGASPVQASIVSGEEQTGVTIIKIDEHLDHGPIISQFKEDVLLDDTTGSLRARLFERSVEVLTTLIPAYLDGKITPRAQEHSKATFTKLIRKAHALIPPEFINSALKGESLQGHWKIPFLMDSKNKIFNIQPTTYNLHNFIRAMQPWPQAWTFIQLTDNSEFVTKKRLKILKAHLEQVNSHESLALDEVQLEGKNPVSWKQFKEAYPNFFLSR